METLKVSWSICGSGDPIVARQVEVETSNGVFQIGVDDNGDLYLQGDNPVSIRPEHHLRFKVLS